MTKLYDRAVEFMQTYPAPSDYGSGNNFGSDTYHGKCAQWVFRFCDFLGWKWPGEPAPPYDTAMVAAGRSGWLNPDANAAPVGAFHFWDNGGDGHVAMDVAGAGTVLAQGYGGSQSPLGVGSGFDTVWGMNVKLGRSGHRYIGWSMNYCGAAPWLPDEAAPAPVPVLAKNERIVGPDGVRGRAASSKDATLVEFIVPGTKVVCDGWEHGEDVDGINVWFRNAQTGTRMWAGNLSPSDTTGVDELVPPTIPEVPPLPEPTPEPVEPPVVVDPTPTPDPVKEDPATAKPWWVLLILGVLAVVGVLAGLFGA